MWNPDFTSAMPDYWPPRPSAFWGTVLDPLRRYYLHKTYGIADVAIVAAEQMDSRIKAGDGVLLTPNHSHDSDPHVMMHVGRKLKRTLYFMAAWQIFRMHGGIDGWVLQRMGAYSVDREGCDRRAMRQTVELLTSGHSVVVFPEGEVYRLNERLTPLREGVAFMACSAQKDLDKAGGERRVWIVPTAIRYKYLDDIRSKLEASVSQLETRMVVKTRADHPLHERIVRLGELLLTIKEKEKLGHARDMEGDLPSRVSFLISSLLDRLEQEHLHKKTDEPVPVRVKVLRRRLIETTTEGKPDAEALQKITAALDDVQLALQLFSYPGDYITTNPSIERMAETIEKFEEDLTGTAYPKGRRNARVIFGEPLDVKQQMGGGRSRSAATELTTRMEGAISELMRQG